MQHYQGTNGVGVCVPSEWLLLCRDLLVSTVPPAGMESFIQPCSRAQQPLCTLPVAFWGPARG